MDKIAVLIPCYNEGKTIKKVVEDFKQNLPEAKIYVYDNNSTDDTVQIAKEAGAIVRYEKKQGKGNVIRTMFREINALSYIMVDGDDTYPAEDAKKMVDMVLNEKVDMVIGDRLSSTYFTENKRKFHNFGNVLVRRLINQMYKSDIRDVMTGYRAFSYNFVKTFPVLSKGFELETEMTIHCLDKNLNIRNYIIEYRDRPEGSTSKLNTVSDGCKVLRTIVNFYKNYKPLSFFSLFAAGMFAIGTVFLIIVLSEFFATGLVNHMPSFVACIFFYLAAVHSFFVGVDLDTMCKKSRQDFEMRLIDCNEKLNKESKD